MLIRHCSLAREAIDNIAENISSMRRALHRYAEVMNIEY